MFSHFPFPTFCRFTAKSVYTLKKIFFLAVKKSTRGGGVYQCYHPRPPKIMFSQPSIHTGSTSLSSSALSWLITTTTVELLYTLLHT